MECVLNEGKSSLKEHFTIAGFVIGKLKWREKKKNFEGKISYFPKGLELFSANPGKDISMTK